MKKKTWIVAIGLALTLTLAVPALAQTTAVAVDGKVYTFEGTAPSYEADGKTFLILEDTVHILEEGKPGRTLPKVTSESTVIVEDIATTAYEAAESGVALAAEDIMVSLSEDIAVPTTMAYSAVEEAGYDHSDSYDQYAAFGLSFDAANSVLYYLGQRVRIFTDEYTIDENTVASVAHFDPEGIVDVEAQRDLSAIHRNGDGAYDPGGLLTGLRVLSQDAFDARDLSIFTEPGQTAVASSGEPLSPAEKAVYYAPYAEVGVHYDAAQDVLTYQGKTVRRFLDIRQTNGESLEGGKFQGTMTSFTQDGGEIDISTLRDYTRPDANGDGKLYGTQIDGEQ